MARKTIAILGINEIQRKNLIQLQAGNTLGYEYDVVTNDSMRTSEEFKDYVKDLIILKGGILNRMIVIFYYIFQNRSRLHHGEVYTSGRFAFYYVALLKLFQIPSLVVERGDIVDYDRYPKLHRLSMRLAYRFGSKVWYREFYMKGAIQRFGAKSLAFIPNSVRVMEKYEHRNRDIDFIWVNRLVKQRKSNWFIDVLKRKEFSETSNTLLGIQDETPDSETLENQKYIQKNKPTNLETLGFQNPAGYFSRAKYFVLPAEIVFANNSLLEAMSYGVVPIISNVANAQELVPNTSVGYLFDHTFEDFLMTMRKSLDNENWPNQSQNAFTHVKNHFSEEVWIQKISTLYLSLRA